jgi:hypothetical protein
VIAEVNPATLVQLGGPGRADRGVVTTPEYLGLVLALGGIGAVS